MFEFDTHSSVLVLPEPHKKINIPVKVENNTKLILYVGINAISICEQMLSLGYVGLSIPNVIKSHKWLQNRISNKLSTPDAIICDLNLPEASLRYLKANLEADPCLKNIPLIFFAQEKQLSDKQKVASFKADDLFYPGYNPLDLHYRIEFIKNFKALIETAPSQITNGKNAEFTIELNFWKRILDIIVASGALMVLSPVLLFIAFMIMLDSRGNVFYISKRAGKNYNVFDFYKFRTMKSKADAELASLMEKYNLYKQDEAAGDNVSFFKLKDDPRITRIGRFLRKTSLDELPQLLNVLKGDMSLVGNRPLPLYEASTLTKDGAASRFLAPAGITGLWQVNKRGAKDMSAAERILLDVKYARKSSLWTDFSIMLMTVPAMLQKEESL